MATAVTARHKCHRCRHVRDGRDLYRTSFDEGRDPFNRDAGYLTRPTPKYPRVWLCYGCQAELIKAGESYAF